MGFTQIDDDAYAADESLSAAILKQIADNGIYAHSESTKGCAMAWDFRYPPILHSIPGGNDSDLVADKELGWMRFLWRPARRVSSLSVRVRATRYVGAVTLGLHILTLSGLISGREIGAPLDTASAGSGEATTNLLATGLSVTPGRLYSVIISTRSVLGTNIDGWYDHNSGTPGTALVSWSPSAFLGIKDSGAANTYWRPSGGAYTDFATGADIPYAIELVSGSDPFTATYDTSKSGPVSPIGRLLRRLQDSDQAHTSGGVATTHDACYVWPPVQEGLGQALALTTTDWIRRTDISYLELHGVQITEDVTSLDSIDSSVAPERAASARAVAAVDRSARRCVSGHPRVWSIAPSPSYDDVDAGIGYKQHAGASVDLTTSFQTISESLIGDPNRFSVGSVDYVQCKYRIAMELHLPCFGSEKDQKGVLTFKFSITERDGSTAAATVVEADIEAGSTPVRNSEARADAGYWLGGYPPYVNDRTPHRHTTQGSWCQTAYRTAVPIFVEAIVSDDSSNGANIGRYLNIEVKQGANVEYPDTRAHLYLDALSVTAVPGLDENAGETI